MGQFLRLSGAKSACSNLDNWVVAKDGLSSKNQSMTRMKTYHLGQQIQCISANSDISLLCCLVGKDILKVLRVEPFAVADADTPNEHEASIQLVRTYKHWGARARYPISHVAWNPHKSHEHIIVGGGMNGQLIFWTLGTSNYTSVSQNNTQVPPRTRCPNVCDLEF